MSRQRDNDQVASDIKSTYSIAVGFTMPSGIPYILSGATVSLFVEDLGTQSAWMFGLFADASGNPDLTMPLVSLSLFPSSVSARRLEPAAR